MLLTENSLEIKIFRGFAPDPTGGAYDAPQTPSLTTFPHSLDVFGVSVEAPSALRHPVPFFHIAEVATLGRP